jgi:hypothetical protein
MSLGKLSWPKVAQLAQSQKDVGYHTSATPLKVSHGQALCGRIDLQFLEEQGQVPKAAKAPRLQGPTGAEVRSEHRRDRPVHGLSFSAKKEIPFQLTFDHIQNTEDSQGRGELYVPAVRLKPHHRGSTDFGESCEAKLSHAALLASSASFLGDQFPVDLKVAFHRFLMNPISFSFSA